MQTELLRSTKGCLLLQYFEVTAKNVKKIKLCITKKRQCQDLMFRPGRQRRVQCHMQTAGTTSKSKNLSGNHVSELSRLVSFK
jgi:hypothetical protein